MKLLIAGALLVGGAAVQAELPNVGYDQCDIVSTDVARADETFIDPEPDATSLRLIVYCGQRVITPTGSERNSPELKVIDVDEEQAVVIVDAANDLIQEDGDVFIGDQP